jgi:hypothetical protein
MSRRCGRISALILSALSCVADRWVGTSVHHTASFCVCGEVCSGLRHHQGDVLTCGMMCSVVSRATARHGNLLLNLLSRLTATSSNAVAHISGRAQVAVNAALRTQHPILGNMQHRAPLNCADYQYTTALTDPLNPHATRPPPLGQPMPPRDIVSTAQHRPCEL